LELVLCLITDCRQGKAEKVTCMSVAPAKVTPPKVKNNHRGKPDELSEGTLRRLRAAEELNMDGLCFEDKLEKFILRKYAGVQPDNPGCQNAMCVQRILHRRRRAREEYAVSHPGRTLRQPMPAAELAALTMMYEQAKPSVTEAAAMQDQLGLQQALVISELKNTELMNANVELKNANDELQDWCAKLQRENMDLKAANAMLCEGHTTGNQPKVGRKRQGKPKAKCQPLAESEAKRQHVAELEPKFQHVPEPEPKFQLPTDDSLCFNDNESPEQLFDNFDALHAKCEI